MKKFNLKHAFFLLATIAAMTIFFCVPAMAYSPKVPTNVHQTQQNTYYIDFAWDKDTQAKSYEWQWCTEADYKADRWSNIKSTSSTSVSNWTSLQIGSFYYVRVRACYPDKTTSEWCEPVQMTTTPHNIPNNMGLVARTIDSLTLKWNPSQTANEYHVSCSENGYLIKEMTVKSPTVKITGLKPDTSYRIKVNAGRRTISDYCAYAGIYIVNYDDFATLPKSITGLKLYDTWGGSTYNFTWNSPKNSQSGYQLEYTDLRSNKRRTVTTTSSNCNLSLNLSKTRFYKVRIRSYRTGLENKRSYSPWSGYTYVNNTNAPKLTHSGSGIKATWSKVYGATSYTVMAKKYGEDTYHKVGSTKNCYGTFSKISGVRLDSGTYYVYIIANRKVGSRTYKSTVCNYATIYK